MLGPVDVAATARCPAASPNTAAAPANAKPTPHTALHPPEAHALPASAAPSALARSAHRDALRVVETVGLETRINLWIVHGALPGRLVRPVALLRDALGAVLEREILKGSGSD